MPFGLWTRMGLRKHVLDGAQIPYANGQWGRTRPTTLCRELCKMAEPIDLPLVLWTSVGRRKHKFNRIRQVAPMCPHGRAHWRHLANTTEPSICGGDAALWQITLTTCYSISCTLLICVSLLLRLSYCGFNSSIDLFSCLAASRHATSSNIWHFVTHSKQLRRPVRI